MTLRYNPKTQEWEGTTGGVNLQELASRKPVKKVAVEKKAADQVKKEILEHPLYGYVKRLSFHIADQYEVEVNPSSFVFRNKKASCYKPATHQIIYGYECVDHQFEKGFGEYPTVAHVWWDVVKYKKSHNGRQSFYRMLETGQKALWQLVLHEMAHFIDKGKSGHQSAYQKILKELIVLFPYEEVKNV